MPVWPCWQCDSTAPACPPFPSAAQSGPGTCLRQSPPCPSAPPQSHGDAAEPKLSSGPASCAMAMGRVNSVLLSGLFPSPQYFPQVQDGREVAESLGHDPSLCHGEAAEQGWHEFP